MAGANSIEIVVSARDDASRVIDGLGTNFQRQARGMESSAADVTRGVRLMAGSLLGELNPALGQSVSQLASATSGARVFGGGLGVLTVTLAATVAGLTQYIQATSETIAKQAALNVAVRSFDTGSIRAKLKELAEDQEKAALRSETAWGRYFNAFEAGWGRITGRDKSPWGSAPSTGRQTDIDKNLQGLAGPAALENLTALNKILLEQGHAFQNILQLGATKAYDTANLTNYLRYTDDLNISLNIQADVEREIIRLEGEKAAAQARGIGDLSGARDIETQTARRLATAGLASQARRGALAETVRLGTLDVRERALPPVANYSGPEPGSIAPADFDREASAAVRTADQAALATRVQLLDIERQRLEITGSLSASRAIELTMLETATKLSDERLTTDQKLLISAEGLLKVQQQLAATDATAGLVKGLNEVASQAERVGDRTAEALKGAFSTVERSWSDGLFAVITGDLKRLPDIGKQFAEGLVRNLTDQFAKLATGGIANTLRGALGGSGGTYGVVGGGGGGGGLIEALLGGGGGGGGILSPTGAPAGSFIMTPGGIGQITPTGAIQLAGGGNGGLSLGNIPTPPIGSFLGGGDSFLGALNATPIDALLSGGIGAVQTTQLGIQLGFYTASGGSTIAAGSGAELALAGSTAGNFAGGGSGAAAAGGATAGAVAGGVLAGVALAFTIYSALQGPPTAQNIALSAISGAVSGAVIGALVGSIFPGVGTVIGAVIGAVAGGAAGGGAAALGKEPKKATVAERSEAEAQIAAGNLSGAIDGASSIEDLVSIFNTRWAAHGELQLRTTYQGVVYWAGDFDDPPAAAATTALMIIPEFLDQLIIQVGQTGAPRLRQDLIDKFRAKRDELLALLGEIPVGSYETDPLARVTRRSTFPLSQIYALGPGTQQLTYSSELLRRDLGADDNTVEFIIRRIREVSSKRDLDLSRKDFLFETT